MTDPTTTTPLDLDGIETYYLNRAVVRQNDFFALIATARQLDAVTAERDDFAVTIVNLSLQRDAAQNENTKLRAALAVSKDPCVYCQLPADEMAACRAGFPGCGRADDLTGCSEFGASMQNDALEQEIATLTAELAALRAQLQTACEVLILAENLMLAITGNEPDDLIADGGITVWHGIVVDAQNWLNIQWPKVETLAAINKETQP